MHAKSIFLFSFLLISLIESLMKVDQISFFLFILAAIKTWKIAEAWHLIIPVLSNHILQNFIILFNLRPNDIVSLFRIRCGRSWIVPLINQLILSERIIANPTDIFDSANFFCFLFGCYAHICKSQRPVGISSLGDIWAISVVSHTV